MQSESVTKLIPALIAAKQQMGPAIKASVNPHFKSRYIDLAGVLDVIDEPLAAHGLTLVQMTGYGPERETVLISMLYHTSGEFIGGRYPLNPAKNDPQGMGAAMTYARRYSAMALVGLAPEDDDGETASGRGNGHSHQQHNGHSNGHQYDRPAQRPAPASRSGGTDAPPAAHNGPPRSGKALFAWVKDQEQQTGVALLRDINDWGKQRGYSSRMVEWGPEEVEGAVLVAKSILYGDREPGED